MDFWTCCSNGRRIAKPTHSSFGSCLRRLTPRRLWHVNGDSFGDQDGETPELSFRVAPVDFVVRPPGYGVVRIDGENVTTAPVKHDFPFKPKKRGKQDLGLRQFQKQTARSAQGGRCDRLVGILTFILWRRREGLQLALRLIHSFISWKLFRSPSFSGAKKNS